MLILILELVRNFNMECLDVDVAADDDVKPGEKDGHPFAQLLDCISLLINKPDRPVKIKFSRLD
jgi:hypothetical protein